MHNEMTTPQLTEAIDRVLSARGYAARPAEPTLRFVPTLESCDGSERSACFRFYTFDWMANPNGVLHGGMAASMLDSAMGILCLSCYEGNFTSTISMTVNYARPIPLDTDVLIRAKAAYTGGTSAQMTAEMYLPHQPDTLLATATGVYYTARAVQQLKEQQG